MTVRALLTGDLFDLADLADLFSSGDPGVQMNDASYWLSSATLDRCADEAAELDLAAAGLLTWVNAAARLAKPDFRPVRLVHRYEVTGPDGVRGHTIVLAESIEIRARAHVAAVGGTTEAEGVATSPPPRKAALAVELARENGGVAEVLDLLAGELDWFTLWKVFEIVEDAVGGQRALTRRGYAKPWAISAFTASANRPDVSGRAARHARASGGIPRRTMTLSEAREFVLGVVDRWLSHLEPHTRGREDLSSHHQPPTVTRSRG